MTMQYHSHSHIYVCLNVQIHRCMHSCAGCDTDVQFPGCGHGIASCRDGHPIYSECVPNYNTGSCECRLASKYTILHACMFLIILLLAVSSIETAMYTSMHYYGWQCMHMDFNTPCMFV